jgi:hypothetical protein
MNSKLVHVFAKVMVALAEKFSEVVSDDLWELDFLPKMYPGGWVLQVNLAGPIRLAGKFPTCLEETRQVWKWEVSAASLTDGDAVEPHMELWTSSYNKRRLTGAEAIASAIITEISVIIG